MTPDEKIDRLMQIFSDKKIHNFKQLCAEEFGGHDLVDHLRYDALQSSMTNQDLIRRDGVSSDYFLGIDGEKILDKHKSWLIFLEYQKTQERWKRLERGLPSWGNLLFAGFNIIILCYGVSQESKNGGTIKLLQEEVAKSTTVSLDMGSRIDLVKEILTKKIDSVNYLYKPISILKSPKTKKRKPK